MRACRAPLLAALFSTLASWPSAARASAAEAERTSDGKDSLARALRDLQDLRRRIDASIEESRPALDRLPMLGAEFDAARDPAALSRSTAALEPILKHMADMTVLRFDYMGVRERINRLQADSWTEQSSSRAVSGFLSEYGESERFWYRTESSYHRLDAAIRDAQQRRDEAVRRVAGVELRRKRHEALRRSALLAACLLASLGSLASWRLRRRRRSGPAPAAVPPGPGSVLADAYRLERELGRGGMGVVYEATDLSLGRKVAVKSALEGLAQDPRELEAILKEAQSVAALKHPNIVSIYTVLREAERLYLVFELVEGRTLAQYLAAKQGLPLKFVKSVVRQICSALEHAHERGIVHRDLKPSNIMVLADGRVKVMDFGIARLTRAAASRLTATRPMGTLLYMAPEQELGSVSKASDIFALGVCAYEMLTGARPFPGPDFLAQKRGMAFPAPSKAAQGLPKGIDDFMRRALNAEPGGRFRSAGEFGEEFERL